ncbi:MAG: nucleotide exchange factor GrpE [Verrucomicrobiota bacterium]
MTDSAKADPQTEEPDEKGAPPEAEDASGEPETAAEEATEEVTPPTVEEELMKWRDLALRNQAELENFRKRMAREKTEAVRYANSSLIESLLPVLDNFQMGLEAARSESADSLIFKGMEMVAKQMEDFLQDQGAQPVEVAPGTAFDPRRQEAMSTQASEEFAEGQVIQVIRRGFTLRGDRLLRAASVIVSSGPAEAEAEDPAGEASSSAASEETKEND